MKLIGVMGNGGSGKTTFTEHLDKRENVGVIHVDDLVGEIKRKWSVWQLDYHYFGRPWAGELLRTRQYESTSCAVDQGNQWKTWIPGKQNAGFFCRHAGRLSETVGWGG